MKIGIYDPYLDTVSGGEKYMLSIAKCLSDQNDVYVIWDKEEDIREKASKKLGLNLSSVKFINNFFNSKTSFVSRYKESKKFDAIIYLSDGSIPILGCNLFIHFQFPVEWVSASIKNRLKIKRAKKVICNSTFTKSFIDKKFGIKSTVLYPPASSFVSGKKQNIILHVGRLGIGIEGSNYKKQDVMIGAFKNMIDKGLKGWEFILVIGIREGSEEGLQKLKEMINGYPIKIIENPQNSVLSDLYSKAKIYWHATGYGEDTEKNPELAEHFGMSTVEAMSAGCVPVVVNLGGQKEIVSRESGFLWDTLDQLKEYTQLLILDNVLLEKMAKESIVVSKKFTGERFCKEVKELIK